MIEKTKEFISLYNRFNDFDIPRKLSLDSILAIDVQGHHTASDEILVMLAIDRSLFRYWTCASKEWKRMVTLLLDITIGLHCHSEHDLLPNTTHL